MRVEEFVMDMPRIIEERTSRLLDEKGERAGNFTKTEMKEYMRTEMRQVVTQVLKEAGITDSVLQERRRRRRGTYVRPGDETPFQQLMDDGMEDDTEYLGRRRVTDVHGEERNFFIWGNGEFRRLPRDFVLTQEGDSFEARYAATGLQAYLKWCLPDGSAAVGALRYCCGADFSDDNSRKRFSDWKRFAEFLHGLIVRYKKSIGIRYRLRFTDVQTVTDQYAFGVGVHSTLVRYLHPSTLKRKRIRTRPHAQAALSVSPPISSAILSSSNTYGIHHIIIRTCHPPLSSAKVSTHVTDMRKIKFSLVAIYKVLIRGPYKALQKMPCSVKGPVRFLLAAFTITRWCRRCLARLQIIVHRDDYLYY